MLFVFGCCSAHVCQNPSLPLWTLGHSDESLTQSRSITAKVGRWGSSRIQLKCCAFCVEDCNIRIASHGFALLHIASHCFALIYKRMLKDWTDSDKTQTLLIWEFKDEASCVLAADNIVEGRGAGDWRKMTARFDYVTLSRSTIPLLTERVNSPIFRYTLWNCWAGWGLVPIYCQIMLVLFAILVAVRWRKSM